MKQTSPENNTNVQRTTLQRIHDVGSAKGFRPLHQIILSSIQGGMYISIGCMLFVIVINTHSKIVAALIFPVGLSFVITSGADLLTSNMMYGIAPFVAGNDLHHVHAKTSNLGRLITVSFIGNMLGCFMAGLFALQCELLPIRTLVDISAAKLRPPLGIVFLKAIGANWLVNLAVFKAATVESMASKQIMLWLPISTFVLLGLEHTVANLFLVPFSLFVGLDGVSIGDAILFLMVCFVGNFLGAGLFIWGQSVISQALPLSGSIPKTSIHTV